MHSLASASTISWLIHQKFELGIPLYRQEKEWEALGLSLSRATMSNWLLCVYRDWLSHVVGHLRQELLKQEYLHIDETHVQVLKEPGKKNTSDSYMWVYCSIRDCKQIISAHDQKASRSGFSRLSRSFFFCSGGRPSSSFSISNSLFSRRTASEGFEASGPWISLGSASTKARRRWV